MEKSHGRAWNQNDIIFLRVGKQAELSILWKFIFTQSLRSFPHRLLIQSSIKRFVHTQDYQQTSRFHTSLSQEAAAEIGSHRKETVNQERGDLGSLRQREAAGIVTMLVVRSGASEYSTNLTLTSRDWSRVQKLHGRFDVCIYIWGGQESSGWEWTTELPGYLMKNWKMVEGCWRNYQEKQAAKSSQEN